MIGKPVRNNDYVITLSQSQSTHVCRAVQRSAICFHIRRLQYPRFPVNTYLLHAGKTNLDFPVYGLLSIGS